MDFLILAIISLITLINPVGIIPTYLSIIENYCNYYHININEKDLKESIQWSLQRGNRTGRTAYQFIVQLAATKDLKIKF